MVQVGGWGEGREEGRTATGRVWVGGCGMVVSTGGRRWVERNRRRGMDRECGVGGSTGRGRLVE